MKSCSAEKTIPLGGCRGRRVTFAAAAVVLTVLMMVVVVTVLMVVWLFVFRKGEKNVRASWLVGAWVLFCYFLFLSLQCAWLFKPPPPPAQKISFVIT